MKKKRVIIDTDPAMGVPFRDIDDGLAILFLMASPEISLEAITINFGNVGAGRGARVANELLDICQKSIPVFTGAESKQQLGVENKAVEYMVDTVNKNPGEITLLAVAPLTNVATAMMLDDTFAENLGELVIMGGSMNFGIFSYFGEFNFHLDGMAASLVMNAPVPKTLITMDVISNAVFRESHLDMLKGHGGAVHRYMVDSIGPWLRLNRKVFFKKKGFFPWDPVAAAYLVDRSLFDENYFRFNLRHRGIRSGSMSEITRCNSNICDHGSCPVNIPLTLDPEGFMDLFIKRLNSYD